MSNPASALANLTAQYTDSENEDDRKDSDTSDSDSSQGSAQDKRPPKAKSKSPPQTPEKCKRPNKSLRLVSYQDDTVVSDDEENLQDSSSSTSDDDYSSGEETGEIGNNYKEHSSKQVPMDVDENLNDGEISNSNKTPSKDSSKEIKPDKYAHYGFSLPPEPKGKPTAELMEKIRHLYEKKETTSNMDMNRIIQERKEFRNPSIYEKLIQYCDINESGTNYPPEVYDPLQWGAESFYEELAKAQKSEMLRRQKERKDNDKIEQATAAARKVEEEAKKRKSKWDQPAPVKSNLVPPALTTTVTGTKGTVISAFGSLPKKTTS